jgi:hypothetical protein
MTLDVTPSDFLDNPSHSALTTVGRKARINVMDPEFGATGNGITDDTAAIQAADTLAAVLGGSVFFPPGLYRVTSSLFPSSGTEWIGCGAASVIFMSGAWAGTVGCLVIDGKTDLAVARLRIDCDRASKGGATQSRGVYVEQSTNVRIIGNDVIDPGHAGILVDGGCDQWEVSGNYIYRGGDGVTAAASNGISVDSGGAPGGLTASGVIANNRLNEITDTGIGVHDDVENVTVIGNTINKPGASGIDIAECRDTDVVGNTCLIDQGNRGIYVGTNNPDARNTENITVTGNTIRQVAGGNALANGISLSGHSAMALRNLAVVGNTITGIGNDGIAGILNIDGFGISGNVIRGCGGDAISLDQGAEAIVNGHITGNTLLDNAGNAFTLHPAGNETVRVFGNFLAGNGAVTNLTLAQQLLYLFAMNGPQGDQASGAITYHYPGTNETCMLVQVDDAGVFSIRRVSIGADNSGDAGHKVLQVPN